MPAPAPRPAIIECDGELYIKISTDLQHAITGKPVFYSDSLVDLVRRHCPQLYDLAKDNGYQFVPSDDTACFMKQPLDIRFDVIRSGEPN